MDSRKEKYYQYVANDLNEKVEFFYDEHKMGFPWEQVWWTETSDGTKIPMNAINIEFFGLSYYIPSRMHLKKLALYLEENYGVREEEVDIIYKLFRNQLLPRIGYPGSVTD